MAKKRELGDLSGAFDPHLKFEDFSKNFLLRLMRVWQRAWLMQEQCWYDEIKNRLGAQAANEIELATWLRLGEQISPQYAKVGNIQLNTVLDSLKVAQLPLDNDIGGLFVPEYEIKTPNHVTMTIKHCHTLEWLEKNQPERIYPVCHVMEKVVSEKYFVNPRINFAPLKLPPLPPRPRSPGEICCQWELTMSK